MQTVDTQDKLTRLEQRSLNTRPTNKLPTMPSEYVFSVAFNDKDILPANTQEQEREFGWALHLDSRCQILCTTGGCWKLHTIFYSMSQKTAQRSEKTAHQSIMACTRNISTTSTIYYYLLLSTTIYYFLLLSPSIYFYLLLSTIFYYYLQISTTILSTLPIPVRPGERSAKRRSGSSSTSSSGWSRWQLCYNATMVPNNYVKVPPCFQCFFHEMSFAFLENLGAI